MSDSKPRGDHRTFLGQSARMTGGAAIASTALSSARILGANDRISLGHIGVGRRGNELVEIAGQLKSVHNVEMTAVCDLWKVNREKAAAANAAHYGRAPRSFQHLEDLLRSATSTPS